MTQSQSLEQACRAAVDDISARYQSALLEHTVFVQRTRASLQQGNASDPYTAALGVYSLALYMACSGQEGPERQEHGFRELHRYLYQIASWRYPLICDDVTQTTLLRTYETVAQCRHPVAFLAFALQHLMNTARTFRQHDRRPVTSLEAVVGADTTSLGALLSDTHSPDPLTLMIDDERRVHLRHLVDAFLLAHPRAVKQLAALLLKYIHGMDDMAISQSLNVPVKSVYELRARASKKLRADPHWRALARTFGIGDEEP